VGQQAPDRAAGADWAHRTDAAWGHQPARRLPIPAGALRRSDPAVTNCSENECWRL